MNHPEPSHPASRSDDSAATHVPAGPSLEELMGRIRLELTGSEEDVLRATRIAGEAAIARAEAAELAAEVLSLDEVVDRIRRELKQRSGGGAVAAGDSATSARAQDHLPRWRPSVAPLPIQPMYVLDDMLRPSDGEFVDNTFRILLRRPASAEERAHYLAELRGGIGKVEILGTIRFSDEGLRHGVHVDGLLIPYKLHKWRRIPVLGWFLAMGIALFRLPRLFAYLQGLEAASARESQQIGHALNDVAQAVETRQARLDEQLNTVAELQRRVQAKLSDQVSALASTIDRLHEQLAMQASVSTRVKSRLDQLEQLEAVMTARLESVQALLSGQMAEQVGELESMMRGQLESVQASLSGQTAEQVGELESMMRGQLESVQTSLSGQAAERVGELEAVMTARLESMQASLSGQTAEQVGELEAAVKARLESVQASLSAQTAEQVGQLESMMRGQLESVQASLSGQTAEQVGELEAAVKARLEFVQASLSGQTAGQVGEFEAAMKARLEFVQTLLSGQTTGQVGELEAAMKARLESVQVLLSEQTAEQVRQLEAVTTARIESVQADQARGAAQLGSRLDAGLSVVAKMTADGAGTRRAVHDIERRLMTLFDRMDRQATGSSAVAPSGSSEDQASSRLLSAHYVSFEDTFRGTRNDIKERAGHYLTTFRDAGIEAGDGLVLDLGCGRGEWLEVLSEHGFVSRGVDMNSVMVDEAQALGFDVVEQDAVAYLRGLDSESVAAVTSMHLVEHLPYGVLIRLVDEALRVLRPGGVLILETPNPENLTVGSYWFYMDPTHRNPIPPPLLQWVVEARGFEGAAIDRLTQNRGVFDIKPVGDEVAAANQINKIVGLLTAAPDYAIVARKPRAEIAQG